MAVLGLVALVLSLNGRLNLYLQPRFQPLVLVSALALVVLSLWTLVDLDRPEVLRAHPPVRASTWLLLVPLLLVVLCAPSPLGAAHMSSAAVAGGLTDSPGTGRQSLRVRVATTTGSGPDGAAVLPPLPTGTVNQLPLDELADRYTLADKADLEGRTVSVLGVALPGPNGGWHLGRFKIFCCAADAVAYQVVLEDLPQEPQTDRWYQVTGVVDTRSGTVLPTIRVTHLEPVPQPQAPYL